MSWRLGRVQAPDRPEPSLPLSLLRTNLPPEFPLPWPHPGAGPFSFPASPCGPSPSIHCGQAGLAEGGAESGSFPVRFPGAQAERTGTLGTAAAVRPEPARGGAESHIRSPGTSEWEWREPGLGPASWVAES